jgi:hypothetical protein
MHVKDCLQVPEFGTPKTLYWLHLFGFDGCALFWALPRRVIPLLSMKWGDVNGGCALIGTTSSAPAPVHLLGQGAPKGTRALLRRVFKTICDLYKNIYLHG